MIETTQPNSPGWWLEKLAHKLLDCRSTYDKLDSYYKNEPPSPKFTTRQMKESYQRLVEMARMNFAELVVEATRERMNPNGFNLARGEDKEGSKRAWEIWQSNHLDADSMLAHRTMLSLGKAYVIVGRDANGPLITCEDPREVITAWDPINRRKQIAGLKMFRDNNLGLDMAYLYLPGVVYIASAKTNQSVMEYPQFTADWAWVDQVKTGIPIIPVVPFVNNPDNYGKGWGEYERHLGVLQRINYTILTRLEISTMLAFRQRAIKGVPDTDPMGDPIDYSDVFAADPGAMWLLPEGADVWESIQSDITGIRSAVKDDVQDLAAVTRTPLFYLTPDANNGSAEGASLAREGLVFKTKDRIRNASESWEQVISLAFAFDDDSSRAAANMTEVLWDDPERFSLAERFDAAVKAQAAGVPWETVMSSVLQYTPQQIDQMASQRASDALAAATLATPAPTPQRQAQGATGASQATSAEAVPQ